MTRWSVLAALLSALALAISIPSAHDGWFLDDLHLVRSYTTAELISVLHGPLDPDHIETPGYRPLETLFHHVTYSVLGEDPAGLRRVTGVLAGSGLALIVIALARLGVPLWIGAAGAAGSLTAKNSAYFLTWLADSYHFLWLGLFGLALLFLSLARMRDRRRGAFLALSIVATVAMLLVKDQGLTFFPILALAPVLPLALQAIDSGPERAATGRALVRGLALALRPGAFGLYVIALVIVAVAAAVARAVFAPGGPLPPSLFGSLKTLVTQARYVVVLPGVASGPDLEAVYWDVLIVVCAAVMLAPMFLSGARDRAPAKQRLVALFLLASAGSALMSGLIKARVDLAYPAQLFVVMWLAASLGHLVGLLRVPARGIATVAMVTLLGVSTVLSLKANVAVQHAMSPWSVQTLASNYRFIYGDLSHATIPDARRAREVEKLSSVGIDRARGPTVSIEVFSCGTLAGHPRLRIPEQFAFEAIPRCDAGGAP